MTAVKFIASAGYLPNRIVTNEELSQFLETSDEWIVSHTGIKQRHYAIDENTSDLATRVAEKLLQQANLKATELDLIIVSTITPDALTPATAAIVQRNIGATDAFAYDLSAACAGFIFALATAHKFISSGAYRRAMVISAETNSKMMDFTDRTSTVFFGDGAAGVIIEANADSAKDAFLAEKLCTLGNAEVIHSGRVVPLSEVKATNYPKLDAFYQDGRAVYNFVTDEVTAHIDQFLAENEIKPTELDLVITHQANLRLIEKIAAHLGLGMDKFMIDVDEVGNTSSAGIPLCLAKALQQGKRPQKVLLTGFGAGLAYGSILLDLSNFA
ncbi:beta-ketoacyl-ACP synthase III [Ligilactobacillus apodemi]|uniref:Beta-ketoacyl-[acyl-carrier-protein] synthase III n=1 Tax=Ligilactobacillus apodemi DSM 16634 = JCM 16172 TaxID=1423724 RepID=A0A0R1TYN3_9LACO|nr:beta-ketoacyl-ACP synthase III [Ligilactobacillus apodemi]KRL85364.1 3-oxoacyl-(acyl carrier protein) synthase III [Ligilactobacillus apodemi DSM 16634 = JCM 16172]MCR1902202.1 ketoacyl-ACP synthase III [Ligilactobacillus apodemi]